MRFLLCKVPDVPAWRRLLVRLAVVIAIWGVVLLPRPVHASWLEGVFSTLGNVEPAAMDALPRGEREIARLDVKPSALVLAATVTAEGHWTFANRQGQRYTAANEKEMARVYSSLAPDHKGQAGPVLIYLVGDAVLGHVEHLRLLPPGAKLKIITESGNYPLRAFSSGDSKVWFAEVANNVFVRAGAAEAFAETIWQLARRLKPRATRIIALDPAGPVAFRPAVTFDTPGGRQAPDLIAPQQLAAALPTLRRQTAIITGRLKDGDELIFRMPGGRERSLALGPVRQAAAANDVNLVFVNATAPRQPGARNWLWLKVEVDGLVDALAKPTFGAFLNGLAGGDERFFVEAQRRSGRRVELRVVPMRAGRLEREPDTLSEVLSELVSEVAGSVQPHAIDADLVSMMRQRELDWRLVAGVPALWQWVFAAVVVVGLAGLPVAVRWWRRIWAPEDRGDYANRIGYETARLMRWLVFFLLFLPVAGIAAMLWGAVRAAARLLGKLQRKKADGPAAIS